MKRAMWFAVLAVLFVAGSAFAEGGLIGSGTRSDGGGTIGSGTNSADGGGTIGSGTNSADGGGTIGSGTNSVDSGLVGSIGGRSGGYFGSGNRADVVEEVWIIQHEDGTLTILTFTTQDNGTLGSGGGRSGLIGSGT